MSNRFLALEERWRAYRRALYLRLGTRAFLGIVFICIVYFGVEKLFLKDGMFSHHGIPDEVATETTQESKKDSSQENITRDIVATPVIKQSQPVLMEQKSAVEEEEPLCFIVKATILNIREDPTLRAKVLSRYVQGDKICAKITQQGWIHSGIGWVHNSKDTLIALQKGSNSSARDVSGSKELSTSAENLQVLKPVLEKPSIAAKKTQKPKEKALSESASKKQKIGKENRTSTSERVAEANNVFRLSSLPSSPKEMRNFQLEQYNRAPSYDSAIELARGYYADRDFTRAREWALIANNHKRSSVESWSIFAKSLYFSGNKDEAIRVLERYREFDSSGALSGLIERMKIEKLKE